MSAKSTLFRLLALLVLGVLLAGCSSEKRSDDITEDWSAEKLYKEARKTMLDGGYNQAVEYYQKLEARYPFGRYSQQGRLDLAYAYFKNDQPDEAIETANRFIKLYPLHPAVDYAYYLKGLVNFRREVSIFERFLPQDLAARQMKTAIQAFDDFDLLVRLFPDGRYAEDARQRMVYLRNLMARHDIYVARFYIERGAWVAAAGRAKQVVQRYPGSPSQPEALSIMVRAYRVLGLNDLADDALRVLKINYPQDPQTIAAAEFQVP